jgi:predicted phosphodiesterase
MIDWNSHPGEVIVVISDLHSNKRAIKATLESVRLKRADKIIILGDVLTYGIDVAETMEMVQKEIDRGAELIVGNHDEMYLDIMAGRPGIFPKLRLDLQESILYNLKRVDPKQFVSWPWKKEIVHNSVYFSHANPYGNAWEYVKYKDDFQMAALKLHNMKHLAGIFGHTHRAAYFGLLSGFLPSIEGLTDDTFVINPGSVGQPRSDVKQATLLRLSSHVGKLWAEIEAVSYDVQAHVQDIQNSSLSSLTKSILSGFF